MRYLIVLISISNLLSASMFDFYYLDRAKKAYDDGNYTLAQKNYAKVDSDNAKFNEADSLYRQKRYKEAIELYSSIKEKKLEEKKLHNIGNCYAKMDKVDEAIKSYEDALKLGEDNDTKYNLELLKKKKKEQKKKDKDKDKDKKKDDKKREDSKKEQKENKKESKDKENSKKDKKEEDNNSKEKDSKKENKDKKREEEKKQSQMSEQNITQPPISNMEERKWQKMLNKRGVNTLMIPLNKGKRENEENPW